MFPPNWSPAIPLHTDEQPLERNIKHILQIACIHTRGSVITHTQTLALISSRYNHAGKVHTHTTQCQSSRLWANVDREANRHRPQSSFKRRTARTHTIPIVVWARGVPRRLITNTARARVDRNRRWPSAHEPRTDYNTSQHIASAAAVLRVRPVIFWRRRRVRARRKSARHRQVCVCVCYVRKTVGRSATSAAAVTYSAGWSIVKIQSLNTLKKTLSIITHARKRIVLVRSRCE